MAKFKKNLILRMQSLLNHELLSIISNKGDYQSGEYEAAIFVAIKRKLITEDEGDNYLSSQYNKNNSHKSGYSNSDVKNGLNNFFVGHTVFFVAFLIATGFNLNFDDPKVGETIIGVLSLIFLFFNVNFFPNEKNEDSIPNTYSAFAIWFAEPFIDKGNFWKTKYDKLFFRKNFISLIIVIPFVLFNFTNDKKLDNVTMKNNDFKHSYSYDMAKTNSEIKKMTNQFKELKDTFNIFYSRLIINEGDSLFRTKNYPAALKSYKSALNYVDTDTIIYTNIGNCFIQLKQKDSAIYYWEKAKLLGSSVAKKKLQRLK